jgi:flagellar motor switch/type III secretory pathway protein FliN
MRGWFVPEGERSTGVIGEFQGIQLALEGQRGRYQLRAAWEGSMIITKAEDEQASVDRDSFSVRLDLGEIEISLEDLLNLRAGSSIEIATEGALRCFLRMGVTTLAAGEISVSGENLTIRVAEIIHAANWSPGD